MKVYIVSRPSLMGGGTVQLKATTSKEDAELFKTAVESWLKILELDGYVKITLDEMDVEEGR